MWTTSAPAKNTAGTPRKNADIELMPCRGAFSIPAGARDSGQVSERPWIQAELARLAEVRLGGCQCFQIPAKSPLMGRNHYERNANCECGEDLIAEHLSGHEGR